MKTIKKSELRKLIKTKSLREIGKIYGVSYERIRQICVGWKIARRGWKRIELVDDEKNNVFDDMAEEAHRDFVNGK